MQNRMIGTLDTQAANAAGNAKYSAFCAGSFCAA
jgi:hypothetical protein